MECIHRSRCLGNFLIEEKLAFIYRGFLIHAQLTDHEDGKNPRRTPIIYHRHASNQI